MAAVSDLELFERAYRLRSSADDGLLRQVFGNEGLEDLAKSRPGLLETARTYFPHLTSSTYERLCREPDALQLEKDRCEREMEQLAVQNYGAFIGSAKVTQAVRQEVVDVQRELDEVVDMLSPIQDEICKFQDSSAHLVTRRASLRNLLQQHGGLLELLELPQLLDACIRNQMYEESLELLTYCSNMLQVHEARGEDIPILSKLKDQVAVQRANLQNSLIAQLMTDIHLPACVKVIGFLRRIQRYSEEDLRSMFIQHRGSFLDKHKQQVELLRASRGSVVTALKNAADLLRTHVYDIGTQYQALFQQDEGPLVPWMNEQIAWLTTLLQAHVLPERIPGAQSAMHQSGQAAGSPSSAIRGAAAGVRIDAASLMMILRQCMQASTALKRLGGHFFPAVAGVFDQRMEHHVCEMLDVALLTFHAELGRYDWVPSTALTSGATAAAAAVGSPAAGSPGAAAAGWLHPQALDLTRHRPLAVLTNDLIQVFNELRQCPLHGLRVPVETHLFEGLAGAVNLLRSVKESQVLQTSTSKASEFTRLCRHFAEILVPLMSAHLEAVFGSSARLDSETLVSGMSPDLLPVEAAEYAVAPEGMEVAAPTPGASPELAPVAASPAAASSPAASPPAASPASGSPRDAPELGSGAQTAQLPASGEGVEVAASPTSGAQPQLATPSNMPAAVPPEHVAAEAMPSTVAPAMPSVASAVTHTGYPTTETPVPPLAPSGPGSTESGQTSG